MDHILTGCPTALSQGRYRWRHDNVLKELAHWIEEKRKAVNSSPLRKRKMIKFLKAGEKPKAATDRTQQSFLNISRDWRMQADLPGEPLRVPAHIAATLQRPDIILTSESVKQLVIVELTVPTEDRVGLSSELKRNKYEEGIAKAAELKGWKTTIYTVEMGCRGFPGLSMGRLLSDIGYQGRQKKSILHQLSTVTEEATMYIYKTCRYSAWKT